MTFQDFFSQAVAYNPETSELVKGGVFTVHAVDDSGLATPLPVSDPVSGATIAELRSSTIGVLPDFRVAGDPPQVVVKSGTFVTKLTSLLGAVQQAGLDPATVQQAIIAGSKTGMASRLGNTMRPISPDPLPAGVLAAAGITLETALPAGFPGTFQERRWDDDSLYYPTGPMVELISGDPVQGGVTRTTGASNQQSTMLDVEFTGTWLLVLVASYGETDVNVYVDGHHAATVYTPSGGYAGRILSIPFASYGAHSIQINFGLCVVVKAMLPITDTIRSGGRRFTVGLMGDSYADVGIGPDFGAALGNAIFEETGWAVVGFGQGSTGYVAQLDAANPSKGPFTHATRVQAVKDTSLDAVIILGSINDGNESPATVGTAATTLYGALAPLPLVVMGLERLHGGSAAATALNAAVKSAAEAAPNVLRFVDWYGEQWQTGNGSVVNPNGTGNQDYIVGTDEVHPSPFGFRYLAKLLAQNLRSLVYTQNA